MNRKTRNATSNQGQYFKDQEARLPEWRKPPALSQDDLADITRKNRLEGMDTPPVCEEDTGRIA